MTKSIQPASKEVLSQHEAQIKEEVKTLVAPKTTWDRNELKSQIEFHINSLYGKAIEENLDGYVNLRFFNGSSPIEHWDRHRFYKLNEIYSKLDEITNLVIKHNKKGNHSATIFPVLCKAKDATNDGDSLFSVSNVYFDIDVGNIAAILENITSVLGKPSFTIASGGKTEDKQNKIHIYYKLNNAITGNKEVLEFFKLKKQFAELVNTDLEFEKPTQVVRLLGSTNHKRGAECTIIDSNKNIYDTKELLDKMANFIESNSQQLPLTANSANKEEPVETLEFPIHQPPLENLTLGEMYDYLIQLGQAPFEAYRNSSSDPKWLDIIFALNHQCQGSQDGFDLALRWSLTDKTGRSEENIREGVKQAYYAAKPENSNKKLLTFRSIINFINNKDFVANEIQKKPHLGEVIRIFSDNLLYDETYVLTENFLCIKVKPKGKNAPPPYLLPICNHLEVLGGGNGSKGTSYRLISYIDTNGKLVENLLAISLKGQELQTYLSEINLQFNTKYYSLIHNYMLNSGNSSKQINIIHKLGWNEDQTCYSLAYKNGIKSYFVDKQANNKKVYLEFGASPDEYLRKKGTLENLKELSRLSIGNDNMILALGVAYAAMWLKPLDEAGRVIHFWGQSQKGKSSLLSLTSSVFGITIGNEDYHDWSTTLNGLENLCKIRNDCPLPMDEAQKVKYNNTLSEAPYMVCGGSGSTRMAYNQTTNNNRATTTWRTLLVSTGEKSYPDIMAERNLSQNIKAGMMNRWCDYPVVTEKFGVFTTLHEFADKFEDENIAAEEFRKYVVSLARKNKGQAISAYLDYVFETKGFDDSFIEIKSLFENWLAKYFYNNPKITAKNSSQEISIAKMFGITAAALKLAVDAGIYDFEKDYIFDVLGRCYNKFLANKVDVHMSAEDRLLKKTLVNFLNTELHKGFYENGPYSNVPVNMYGIKEQLSFCANEISKYDYYVEVGKWDIIFKGQTPALVKRFLRNNEFIAINPAKSDSKKTEYSFNKHNRLIGRSANYNKLDLIKIGFLLPDDEDDPEPTPSKPTDKLKDLPCESISSSSNIEPALVNTDISNSSSVTNTTAVESNVNSTFKPKWRVRERNELLDYLEPYYKEGREITYFEFQTSDFREWDKLSLHELVKPIFVIGIKGELDSKPQLFRIRNVKLSQLERETVIKCIFNDNFTLHFNEDLQQILEKLQGQQVHFSYAVDGEEKKPKNLRVLFFKPKGGKTIGVRLEKGIISHAEQIMLNNINLIFSKASCDHRLYFPFINFDYTHAIDIALATRYTDTTIVNSLSEPCVKGINFNILGCESANIARSLIKNQDIFSKIEPEILNEFRYRDSIINTYNLPIAF